MMKLGADGSDARPGGSEGRSEPMFLKTTSTARETTIRPTCATGFVYTGLSDRQRGRPPTAPSAGKEQSCLALPLVVPCERPWPTMLGAPSL
jgi:hypothetical protein